MKTKVKDVKKMETIEINGKEIRAKHMSCLDAYIIDKTFSLYIKQHFAEKGDATVSITENKIIELLNDAESFAVTQDTDEKDVMILRIETKTHSISVMVKKEVM